MALEEIKTNGWTLEEACNIFGLDSETLIECMTSSKPQNRWAIDIIQNVLELDYEDVVFAS